MILADTSVWVQHFRCGLPGFAEALQEGHISMHPIVLGELAVGNLARRIPTLAMLRSLPRTKSGTAEECLAFIEARTLHGRGVAWNDLQLLVAALLSSQALWSLDTCLNAAAAEMGIICQFRP